MKINTTEDSSFGWQWYSTRVEIECHYSDIRTGGLAVPTTILTTIQETKSSAVWQRIQCRLQCRVQCRVQCRIWYEVIVRTIVFRMRSRLRLGDPELRNKDDNWRLQINFRIKPFQLVFPTKPYQISRWWSNDIQQEGDNCAGISNNPYRKKLPSRMCRNDAPWDTFTHCEG